MRLAVTAESDRRQLDAQQLAEKLKLPCIAGGLAGQSVFASVADYLLVFTDRALELRPAPGSGIAHGPVRAQLDGTDIRRRTRGGHRELLARAVGLKAGQSLAVLDATGGLGRDAAVLASLGATVTLIERNPVIHSLLDDGLHRASGPASSRLQLLGCQDSRQYLLDTGGNYDVVYLDPMFPERGKTALAAKELQSLRRLVGEGELEDVPALLEAALSRATQRVVVKRHPRSDPLRGLRPNYQLSGERVRYDIYPVFRQTGNY